jgi:protein gp37
MSKKIEWCDKTLNPISGCLNGCPFCYAKGFAHRQAGVERKHPGRSGYPTTGDPFRPTFHSDKIRQILKLGGGSKRVFLDSMGDWFSPGVEIDWIRQTVDAVKRKPEHIFLVLTKRPDRIGEMLDSIDVPGNLWLGTSITTQDDAGRVENLKRHVAGHKFLSIEPLHGPIEVDLSGIEWVIIGAETGNRKAKIKPKSEWVEAIWKEAEKLGIPVFLKNNIRPYLPPGCSLLRQYPKREMA